MTRPTPYEIAQIAATLVLTRVTGHDAEPNRCDAVASALWLGDEAAKQIEERYPTEVSHGMGAAEVKVQGCHHVWRGNVARLECTLCGEVYVEPMA